MRKSDRVLAAVSWVLSDLDTAVSLSMLLLIRNGEWAQLVNKSIDPMHYNCAESFRKDYLAVSLLAKYPDLETGIDRKAVAIDKFKEAEVRCTEVSTRLRSAVRQNQPDGVAGILHSARRKIQRCLGPFSWDEASRYFRFGPGANVSLRRRDASLIQKIGVNKPTVTAGCSVLGATATMLWPAAFSEAVGITCLQDALDRLHIVPGNTVTTVPKSAKTDRIIAVEPLLNSYIQSGIGGLIRSRLGRVGVNLNDQVRNQQLAQLGSACSVVATVDLSAASDSVSLSLLEELLDSDWLDALKQARSPIGTLPSGETVYYRKVSSMGCGFTFELESLLFWALAKACTEACRQDVSLVSVYGDDIIVPVGVVDLLRDVLRVCGFVFNDDKSFWSGPFRESCGKHYFLGADVTPIYVREDIDDITRVFWFANSLRRWAYSAVGQGYGCADTVKRAYYRLVGLLPSRWRRPSVPLFLDGLPFTDGALGGDLDEVAPKLASSCRKTRGWEGWCVRFLMDVPRFRSCGEPLSRFSTVAWFLRKEEHRAGPRYRKGTWVDRHLRALKEGAVDELVSSLTAQRLVHSVVRRWEDSGPWVKW